MHMPLFVNRTLIYEASMIPLQALLTGKSFIHANPLAIVESLRNHTGYKITLNFFPAPIMALMLIFSCAAAPRVV